MPWHEFSYLTAEDAAAIAAYLQSLPPVKHAIDVHCCGFGDRAVVDVYLVGRLAPAAPADFGQSSETSPRFSSQRLRLPVFLPVSPCYLCLEESI